MSFAADGPPAQLSMSASSADNNVGHEGIPLHHASENSGSEWATGGLMLGVGDAQAEYGRPEHIWIAGTDLGQPVSARPLAAFDRQWPAPA